MGCGQSIAGSGNNMSSDDPEALFAVRPECAADVKKTRFKPRRGRTLSARKWQSAFSKDGHLDMGKVLGRIQRGGVHPSIKGVVWEFLLGCYDPNSTYDERSILKKRRRERYLLWKEECQKMEPTVGSGRYITTPVIGEDGQPIQDALNDSDSPHGHIGYEPVTAASLSLEKKDFEWKRTLHQIGLDVARTDRTLVFYENEANLAKLWDILAVYAWIDKDIGYCQGMSDICSPMVLLLENEADAFWCFERVMRRLRSNFQSTTGSIGVQSQLSVLAEIIQAVNPKLHQLLEELDGGEYLFAFRMLMVLFRREFSFVDAMYLWELIWAMEYNPNIFALYEKSSTNSGVADVPPKSSYKLLKKYGKFERKNVKTGTIDQQRPFAIFLVASVLEGKKKQFLREAKGLDDVVKILNDTTGNLDAKKACQEALKVHKKYLSKTKKS